MRTTITVTYLAAWLLAASVLMPVLGAPAGVVVTPRPMLQVINGSSQPIDIFWLKTDAERVPNGSVAAGKDTIVTTTLGHRFVVVGREDKSEVTVTSVVPVQGVRFDPADPGGVPAFYTERASAGGFPIVASAKVNPYALKEAVFLADMMFAKRPDVRDAMVQSGARMSILAWNEFTTDLPEFAHMKPKDFWDARARGTGGSATDPYCTSAEENLLGYPGDPYSTESIFIHEFAHSIHLRGMSNVDPSFDGRAQAAYDAAMKAGLWKGKYASVNHHEYFAEGVQSWFDNNREPDHDHNHVNTRAELLEYDPGLAALCREVFGDTELKYTKPGTRLRGHMAGYDPTTAPKFEWPERLAKVKQEIAKKARDRDAVANTPRTNNSSTTAPAPSAVRFDPVVRDMEGWKVHIEPALVDGAHGEEGAKALTMLANHLQRIKILVPAAPLAKLQQMEIWIEHRHPSLQAMQYHPSRDWLVGHGHDPRLTRKVHIPQARELVSREQMLKHPAVVLHELAHAYHDQILGFEDPEIIAAYENAKAAGTYDKVLLYDGKRVRHYALTNHKEYFAEATESYFYRNDFYPFVRAELKEHDPGMLTLLEKIWGTTVKPVSISRP